MKIKHDVHTTQGSDLSSQSFHELELISFRSVGCATIVGGDGLRTDKWRMAASGWCSQLFLIFRQVLGSSYASTGINFLLIIEEPTLKSEIRYVIILVHKPPSIIPCVHNSAAFCVLC